MDTSERYRLCVEALRGFAEGAGFSDAVIGLSGGMDSSIVAVMCVDRMIFTSATLGECRGNTLSTPTP